MRVRSRKVGPAYLSVGGNDGLHVIVLGWHWHIFVWTRGHRRNPVYSTLRKCSAGR